jgi:AraC-like DNA-binding protein
VTGTHNGADPAARPINAEDLLADLAAARRDLDSARRRLRLLIAYGREFVEPRPYTLADLARAAGMSISGVRTAYTAEDVNTVNALTQTRPRATSRFNPGTSSPVPGGGSQ